MVGNYDLVKDELKTCYLLFIMRRLKSNLTVNVLFFFLIYRLKILDARLSDSGNYSCVPTAAEGSSVIVHVINGKRFFELFFIRKYVLYATPHSKHIIRLVYQQKVFDPIQFNKIFIKSLHLNLITKSTRHYIL